MQFLIAADESVPILHEQMLSGRKNELIGSFVIYKKHLEKTNQLTELKIIQDVMRRLNDFHYIEPKDRFMVTDINAGNGSYAKFMGDPEDWPDPANREEREVFRNVISMRAKYPKSK